MSELAEPFCCGLGGLARCIVNLDFYTNVVISNFDAKIVVAMLDGFSLRGILIGPTAIHRTVAYALATTANMPLLNLRNVDQVLCCFRLVAHFSTLLVEAL